uniref:Uncharacterized protein n=1 Tax=Nelumbo nucifera TaxID=4432 RepID=A0A822YH00_NELNU|nr:TPA_asm: hypothetical protein HUJ06_010638 [Nelumbo nucifera]
MEKRKKTLFFSCLTTYVYIILSL